jgi:predicted metal-dependent hydrolase
MPLLSIGLATHLAYVRPVSKKSAKIAALIADCQSKELPAHYLGYFECFNQGRFYEAHDVLEELWLTSRGGPNDAFYKGLIQFAGAFVHLQKHSPRYHRLRPAAALFRLARANLQSYQPSHERLDLQNLMATMEHWIADLEKGDFRENPFKGDNAPLLHLQKGNRLS